MSQTSQNPRYATALASLQVVQAAQVFDLTAEDYEFVTSNRIWISTDRSRARRCVEALVYGTLDYVGYPRFPAPAEFVAAAIATFVHPVNLMTACLIMEGAEFSEHIIAGVSTPLEAPALFAHVLQVRGCNQAHVDVAEMQVQLKFAAGGM